MQHNSEQSDKATEGFPTWLNSQRFLARRVARPTHRFMQIEASGGIALLAATALALIWVNSPWSDSYMRLWDTSISFGVGDHVLTHDLVHWVNDGLMVLFFFVVGLEIKKELVVGRLSSIREASLPVVAAIGGMIVPALIYFAFNAGTPGARGWGIPMATDIAFAVGVMALLGSRVPGPLKVMLLALAIVDDIGAIVVIAIFYTEKITWSWLVVALFGLAAVMVMQRAKVWYVPAYVVVGLIVWFATFQSGIHATIAGVALGLLTPARPLLSASGVSRIATEVSLDEDLTVDEIRDASFELRESVSVAERLQELLHPWTSFVIIPMFALANAGIVISGDVLSTALGSRVTIGIILGLVVGKFVGITGASTLAVKLGIARLPEGVTLPQVGGMSMVAGIGFTVSLFISGLAFTDELLDAEAKIGILVASAIAALLGVIALRTILSGEAVEEPTGQ
ncbi:MAG: Na+/H+ antiporter NhaA [Microthrixaceae bacterium]